MNVNLNNDNNDYVRGFKDGKKAGMAAECERAKALVDALRDISESKCDYESTNYAKSLHSPECRACKAKQALEQWEGKEVGDE